VPLTSGAIDLKLVCSGRVNMLNIECDSDTKSNDLELELFVKLLNCLFCNFLFLQINDHQVWFFLFINNFISFSNINVFTW